MQRNVTPTRRKKFRMLKASGALLLPSVTIKNMKNKLLDDKTRSIFFYHYLKDVVLGLESLTLMTIFIAALPCALCNNSVTSQICMKSLSGSGYTEKIC